MILKTYVLKMAEAKVRIWPYWLFCPLDSGYLSASCEGFTCRKAERNARFSYRGTSPIRKIAPLDSYSRSMPKVLGGPRRGGRFLMSEAPL